MSGALPWAAWFRHAVLDLGLPPTEFWELSVAEWRTLTMPPATAGDAGALKAEMERLMRDFPDRRLP